PGGRQGRDATPPPGSAQRHGPHRPGSAGAAALRRTDEQRDGRGPRTREVRREQAVHPGPGAAAGGAGEHAGVSGLRERGAESILQEAEQVQRSSTIAGPGANVLSVSGNNASRVFEVFAGATASINGLTISSGWLTDTSDHGGGILVNVGATLTVNNCTIS